MATYPVEISNEAFFGSGSSSSESGDESGEELVKEEVQEVQEFLDRRPTFNKLYETLSKHSKESKTSILTTDLFSPPKEEKEGSIKNETYSMKVPSQESLTQNKGDLLDTLLEFVLMENGLQSCIPIFKEAEVDLDAFLLLTDEDFEELGFKLGTRKKLSYLCSALDEVLQEVGGSEGQKQLNQLLSNIRKESSKKKKKPKSGDKKKGDGNLEDSKTKKKKTKTKKKSPTEETKEVVESKFTIPEPSFEPQSKTNRSTKKSVKIDKPDISVDELVPSADLKGWLWKQGGNAKSWKRRYCTLNHKCFYYFSSPSKSKSKGMLLLPGYEIKEVKDNAQRPFSFTLSHPTSKGCYLVAETKEDMDAWMNAMKRAANL